MGKIYSEEDKERLVKEYKASNVTMRQFSLENNMPPSTLATWLYKENNSFGVIDVKEKVDTNKNESIVFKNSTISIELKSGYDKLFLDRILQVITND